MTVMMLSYCRTDCWVDRLMKFFLAGLVVYLPSKRSQIGLSLNFIISQMIRCRNEIQFSSGINGAYLDWMPVRKNFLVSTPGLEVRRILG